VTQVHAAAPAPPAVALTKSHQGWLPLLGWLLLGWLQAAEMPRKEKRLPAGCHIF